MVFADLPFLYLFLPCCLLLYFTARGFPAKNAVLCVLSMVFYAMGEPVWVVLLLFSALVDYVNSRVIDAHRGQWQAKAAMTASLVINLGLLFFFKYIDLFLSSIGALVGQGVPTIGVALPIGISFYTFQTLSYTLDVYRGEVDVQRDFPKFLLFVSLFPQLIAGPILRYKELAAQLDDRRHTLEGIARGLTRFMTGLAKKVLIANFVGQTADNILGGAIGGMTTPEAWLGILCFTFQIYFDFSGYSDMAIGLGQIFGFEYGENFKYPYLSRSVTEFWRRWHISLGTFFRDYVYIPLGGNRKHQIRNILIVWLLTGLWHGASWNFLVWGLYFGVFLVLEKFVFRHFLHKIGSLSMLYSFFVVVIGWVLFYFTDLSQGLRFLGVLFGGGVAPDSRTAILWLNNAPLLLLCVAASTQIGLVWKRRLGRLALHADRWRYGVALVMSYNVAVLFLCTAALVGSGYNPFLYYRF